MSPFQRFTLPLKLTLLLYLLVLAGLGSYLFWPAAEPSPLGVSSVRLAPEGDRILLEGEGFGAATQVSLVLDVNNNRFLRHTVPTWEGGGDLVRVGRFAYASALERGLLVLDLAEPARPQLVATLNLPGPARNLVVAEGVAYIACDQAGLALVDVRQPASPTLLSTVSSLTKIQGLAITAGRLYVTLFASGVDPALAVVDVSNPRQPHLLGRQPLPGKPIGVALRGDQLLVAAGNAGLLILELGQGLPRLITQLPLPGPALSVLVVGEHAYVTCTKGGLAVIGWGPSGPNLLAHLPLPGVHVRMAAGSGRLYLPATGGGRVIDIEHPSQPRSLGVFPAPRSTLGAAVLGEWLYLNSFDQGIQVLDLTDPTPLQSAEQVGFEEMIVHIAVEEKLMAVATTSGNLHLLQGEDGKPLRPMASLPLKGVANSLHLAGGYAYANILNYGLEIVDLRSPEAPVSLRSYPLAGGQEKLPWGRRESSLVLAKNRGSLVDKAGRIWLFDSAETGGEPRPGPDLPEAVGELALGDDLLFASTQKGAGIRPIAVGSQAGDHQIYPPFALPAHQINGMVTLGRVVVAACGLEGVYVVDFNNPAAPRLLAVVALPIQADQIRLQGTTVYIGASAGGLLPIDLSDPARPVLGPLFADGVATQAFAVTESRAVLAPASVGVLLVPLPQRLLPLTLTDRQMSLALPPIDTPGFYTLRLTAGDQSVTLPGALELSRR